MNQLRGFTDRARSLAGAVPSKLSLPVVAQPARRPVGRAAAGGGPDRHGAAAVPRRDAGAAGGLRPAAGRVRAASSARSSTGAPPGPGSRRPSATSSGRTTPPTGRTPSSREARSGRCPSGAPQVASGRRPWGGGAGCPVTEPIRAWAWRSPWISGIRSSLIRRSVSGTVSTAGSSSTRPTRSRPGRSARTGSSSSSTRSSSRSAIRCAASIVSRAIVVAWVSSRTVPFRSLSVRGSWASASVWVCRSVSSSLNPGMRGIPSPRKGSTRATVGDRSRARNLRSAGERSEPGHDPDRRPLGGGPDLHQVAELVDQVDPPAALLLERRA